MRRRSSCAGPAPTGSPPIETSPALGSISRLTVLSRVDLPDPELPTNATKLPAATSSVTPSTPVTPG